MNKHLFLSIAMLFCMLVNAQKTQFPVATIADSLILNANAVIRLDDRTIDIETQQKMTIKTKKVVTILNENGFSKGDYICYFSKSSKVKSIKLTTFDANGLEIKTYKKGDFKDESVGDGFSIFNDDRVLYLDFTPTQYPMTILFESEQETSNTAFIPRWFAVSDVSTGIEKSVIKISFATGLGFDFREENFTPKYNITKTKTENSITYEVSNLIPQKPEDWSPNFYTLMPQVLFRVTKFNLEGVDGEATTWKEMGTWYYKNILTGTNELPAETVAMVKKLVGDEKNPITIAKKVYQFVQDKTRYVSIQVGIGGFKPMLAKDVDRLGYGDCKALSNYTRCLLEAVGVTSYYTEIYGGSRTDFNANFASTQGNHVILALPVDKKYVFMECTSQTNPFGYQGDFTDNRMALVVKPEGGELVRTYAYTDAESSQLTTGQYTIMDDGSLTGKIKTVYKGVQYDKYANLERQSKKIQTEKKISQYRNINNLTIENLVLDNDKEKITFTEEMNVVAKNYADVSDKLMFAINAFNNNNAVPKRYRKREYPFEIQHGFLDIDNVTITFPENYVVEAISKGVAITSKFGVYKTEIGEVKNNSFTYKRSFTLNTGKYDNKDYNDFRLFMEQVARNDNSKILLQKK